jgi:hypothetical protein
MSATDYGFASMATFPLRSLPVHREGAGAPSFYPSVQKARDLSAQIGVKPTIETLKRLEHSCEQTVDPRSRKKARTPLGKDEVSLGWSSNEMVVASPTLVAGLSGFGRRYKTRARVLSNDTNDSTAAEDKHNSSVVASEYTCLTLSALSETEAVWMLDSGASQHFTFDLNDLVDYEAIEPIPLRTATNFTTIIGKGTVILYISKRAVRLNPVYFVPDISHRLLSLGQFL